MKPSEYQLVQQKEDWDCAIACIAMWCKVPYDDVVEYIKSPKSLLEWGVGLSHDAEQVILKHFGKTTVRLLNAWGGVPGILSFPSLNIPGGAHAVFYDGHRIFDPNNGRPGKKSYGDGTAPLPGVWPGCYSISVDLNDAYSRECAEMELIDFSSALKKAIHQQARATEEK